MSSVSGIMDPTRVQKDLYKNMKRVKSTPWHPQQLVHWRSHLKESTPSLPGMTTLSTLSRQKMITDRFRITFAANNKRQFVPSGQVFLLLVVCSSLYPQKITSNIISRQFHPSQLV